MSPEMLFVLGVGAVAIVLFVTERFPLDQVAIAVPAALLLGGVVDLETAVSGLSSPATIAVAGFLVIGLALGKTGVVAAISRLTERASAGAPAWRLLIMCLVVAAVSPFLSNVAVVVVFLPVFVGLAASAGQPPSRVLIPLSYVAILGGTLTLIGTSTNLIVHGAARDRGYGELSLFSIAPLGLIYLAIGLLYLFTIGRRLLPDRPSGDVPTEHARAGECGPLAALGEPARDARPRGRSWLAVAILVVVVAAAAIDAAPIATAAFVGAIAMVFAGCVRMDEIYRELDWPVIALLAGLLPLGTALDTTGAADLLGRELASVLGGAHPALVVGCFYLVTSLLTEMMSNQAAAVVLTPLAIATAERLEMNPYALLVAVMFGASAAFMTPMGYQTNALVYRPGGYRFGDYLRVGAPLNLLLAVVATLAIPWMWP